MALTSHAQWYLPDKSDPCLEPAKKAFDQALSNFKSTVKIDDKGYELLNSAQDIQRIEDLVNASRQKYESSLDGHGPRKWLARFSSRILFYSNILDVFAQHHPEFVALAWGAMKTLFVLFENHEKTIQLLAKALSQIAESLPRAKLAVLLYPTKVMMLAVATLYGYIVTFFVRAKQWYEENKFMHVLHSLTRPVELRYRDLVDQIEACSLDVHRLAQACSQSEQRDIHLLLTKVWGEQLASNAIISEIQIKVQECQTAIGTFHLDTSSRLDDLQLAEILNLISRSCRIDELKCFQRSMFICSRLSQRTASPAVPLWKLPKFQAWNLAKANSLLVASGDKRVYPQLQHLCVSAVQLLRDNQTNVLFALNPSRTSLSSDHTNIDVLKSLVSQALKLNLRLHTDKQIGLTWRQFCRADTEHEWISLLGMTISSIPLVYIVLDLQLLGPTMKPLQNDFSWIGLFEKLFAELNVRSANTIVKVILINRGPMTLSGDQRRNSHIFILPLSSSNRSTALTRKNVPIRVGKLRSARNILNFLQAS